MASWGVEDARTEQTGEWWEGEWSLAKESEGNGGEKKAKKEVKKEDGSRSSLITKREKGENITYVEHTSTWANRKQAGRRRRRRVLAKGKDLAARRKKSIAEKFK